MDCRNKGNGRIFAIQFGADCANHCVMSHELLIALLGFAFVTSITPGPNNIMLMTSGANFGFRRSLPHMLGVSLGHSLLVFLTGLGIGAAFRLFPALDIVLKVAAVGYMLWLAWKILHAAAPGDGVEGGVPLTFVQAAAFQWVNPKGWAMALGATAAYAPGDTVWAYTLVALVFCSVNLPSVSVWTLAGQGVRQWLTTGQRLRLFNGVMAVLLVASLVPVIWH
jgi:threonine/homoserine/homoserine lactone efflux protein